MVVAARCRLPKLSTIPIADARRAELRKELRYLMRITLESPSTLRARADANRANTASNMTRPSA